MTRVKGQSRRKGVEAAPALGAQGEPLSAYAGWDAESGVFRLDGSLSDLEERYRRVADQGDEDTSPLLPPPVDTEGAAAPTRG